MEREPAPRDRLGDIEYFESENREDLSQLDKMQEVLLDRLHGDNEEADEETKRYHSTHLVQLAPVYVDFQLRMAERRYSMGHSLDEIGSSVQKALDDVQYLNTALERFEGDMWWERPSYYGSMLWLTFGLLYHVASPGRESLTRYLDLFKSTDSIILFMRSSLYGGVGTKVSGDTDLDFPELYGDLWRGLSATSAIDRQSATTDYIENWYERNRSLDVAPKAFIGIDSHQTMINYRGYWCWEAVVPVLLANVDDAPFRDHPHYPVDLADWCKNQG